MSDAPLLSRSRANLSRVRVATKDNVGMLLNGIVCCAGTLPPLVVLVGIATGLDPFYFIIEDLILPHPYYRSLAMIVMAPCIRFILGYLCVIEFARFATIVVTIIVVTVFVILSIAKKLRCVFYQECYLLYLQLRLILGAVQLVTRVLVFGLVFGSQFATVLLLWLVFKCYGYISIYIYSVAVLLAVYFISLVSLLLPTIAKVRSESRGLIRSKLNLHFSTNPQRKRKYYYYSLWRSQQSVYLSCGNFFVLQKGVTMTYLKELINNLVNAVILIDPKSL